MINLGTFTRLTKKTRICVTPALSFLLRPPPSCCQWVSARTYTSASCEYATASTGKSERTGAGYKNFGQEKNRGHLEPRRSRGAVVPPQVTSFSDQNLLDCSAHDVLYFTYRYAFQRPYALQGMLLVRGLPCNFFEQKAKTNPEEGPTPFP